MYDLQLIYYCLFVFSRVACASGWFSYGSQTVCTECPAGSRCPSTITGPVRCDPGYYTAAGAANCTACEPGYYCPQPEGMDLFKGYYLKSGICIQGILVCMYEGTDFITLENVIHLFVNPFMPKSIFQNIWSVIVHQNIRTALSDHERLS